MQLFHFSQLVLYFKFHRIIRKLDDSNLLKIYIFLFLYIASHTFDTLEILGITFGCLVLVVGILILGIYVHKKKRQMTSNQNVQVHHFSLVNTHDNMGRTNRIHVPNPILMSTLSGNDIHQL